VSGIAVKGSFQLRDARLTATRVEQSFAMFKQRVGVVGAGGDRALIRGGSLVAVASQRFEQAQLPERHDVVGLQFERLLVSRACFVEAAQFQECPPELPPCFQQFRIESGGLSELLRRGGKLGRVGESHPGIEPCQPGGGGQSLDALEKGDGFGGALLPDQCHTERRQNGRLICLLGQQEA